MQNCGSPRRLNIWIWRGATFTAHSTSSVGIRTVRSWTIELPTLFFSISKADGESTRTPVVARIFSVY
jgi:hypothetical protein